MRLTFGSLAVVTGACSVLTAAAFSQPTFSTPPTFVDLGDVGIGATIQSPVANMPQGLRVWYRFRLLDPVEPFNTWLDIDTATPGGICNTYVALYDTYQNRLAIDDESGGGNGGTCSSAAAMSFGSGSARRLTILPDGGFGGRVSTGVFGTTLEPGVYWIGVAAGPSTFPDPNPNWDSTTSSTLSGGVSVKITTGRKPDSQWNERYQGEDAGTTPGTASVPDGVGPLETILTAFSSGSRDMFKIQVCNPAAFAVTMESTMNGGGTYQSRLFLFDANGRGVAGINGTASGTNTRLTLPSGVTIPAGIYYLAVSNNCAGSNGYSAVPYDASRQQIWDFSVIANQSIAPNGPGAANPILFWGRQQSCTSDGAHWVKLSLSGVCYARTGACSGIDFNNNTVFPEDQDVIDFFNVLAGGTCP